MLKITDDVYRYYIENVRGNENTSFDQVRRKLTRNIVLAKKVVPRNKMDRLLGIVYYQYGNLHLTVRWNKVIDIKNYSKGKHTGAWKKDQEKYEQLTKELGIVS